MRRENWPELLDEFITRAVAFDWVDNNCALFAAEAVEVVTGVDYSKRYRGPRTKKGMLNRLARVTGGGDVIDAATRALGEPKLIVFAQRGDIVARAMEIDGDAMPALGVCLGDRSAFLSLAGVELFETQTCSCSWRVD